MLLLCIAAFQMLDQPIRHVYTYEILNDHDHHHRRVVHGSDGPAGRVGSGRVTILPDFGESGRVGSALRIYSFFC